MLIPISLKNRVNALCVEGGSPTESNLNSGKTVTQCTFKGVSPLLGKTAESAPTSSGTLANPVNVAGELALKRLPMTKFDNRELPSDLPTTPTSSGPLIALGKQRRVRGGWASGDGGLPVLMKIHNREQTGGEVRMGE